MCSGGVHFYVEKTPHGILDLRMFAVNRRNRDTLRPIIERHVAGGTTVVSDEWRAYSNLRTWRPRENPAVRYVRVS